MHRILSRLFAILVAGLLARAGWLGANAQGELNLEIQSPQPGQAVQGSVPVIGSTAVDGFRSGEISFAYSDHPTGTWFIIRQLDRPVELDLLTLWDTTTITDGDYDLRLVVFLEDGTRQEVKVTGVRVRNYTSIETSTPEPSTLTPTPAAGETPAASPDTPGAPAGVQETAGPTRAPAPLPSNPAQISRSQVYNSMGAGALSGLGIIAIISLYISMKRIRRR